MSADGESPTAMDLSAAIRRFSRANSEYYLAQFSRIQGSGHRVWSFNWAAGLLGPFWAAARGVWGFFWTFALLELVALVQLGRGLWGDLGADKVAEADKVQQKATELGAAAEEARLAGDGTAEQLQNSAENLSRAAQETLLEAEQAVAGATTLLVVGLVLFLAIRIAAGFLANPTYEKQFTRWRLDKAVPSGLTLGNALFGALLGLMMYPLTLYRFTASKPDARITGVPIGNEYFTKTASVLEGRFDRSAVAGKGLFDGITATVQSFLDVLELILIGTPCRW